MLSLTAAENNGENNDVLVQLGCEVTALQKNSRHSNSATHWGKHIINLTVIRVYFENSLLVLIQPCMLKCLDVKRYTKSDKSLPPLIWLTSQTIYYLSMNFSSQRTVLYLSLHQSSYCLSVVVPHKPNCTQELMAKSAVVTAVFS